MDTHKTQPDTDFSATDPAFDALLDEAVSAGTPPADPQLADRIYRQTLPMLGQRPVLARIGPTLLRIAAAVAIIAGGVFAVSMLNQEPAEETLAENNPPVQPVDLQQIGPELAELEQAIEPGNTLIDEQLDVLALRVEMARAESENAWGADGLSSDDMIERAVVRFEIDQLSDDTALYLADEPMLF